MLCLWDGLGVVVCRGGLVTTGCLNAVRQLGEGDAVVDWQEGEGHRRSRVWQGAGVDWGPRRLLLTLLLLQHGKGGGQ